MEIKNDVVPCIFCGGETKRVSCSNFSRYMDETRRCKVCGRAFEHISGYRSKDDAAYCSVKDCPERDACELKDDATNCAVYRMIVVRGICLLRK